MAAPSDIAWTFLKMNMGMGGDKPPCVACGQPLTPEDKMFSLIGNRDVRPSEFMCNGCMGKQDDPQDWRV